MAVKDIFNRIFGKEKKELPNFPPLENNVPDRDYADHVKGIKSIRAAGVNLIYYPETVHNDKNVEAKLKQLVAADAPELLFIEFSRDAGQKYVDKNGKKFNKEFGISDKTQVICVDLPYKEKLIQGRSATEMMGLYNFHEDLQEYQISTSARDTSLEKSLDDQAGDRFQALAATPEFEGRLSKENNAKVAKYKADKIADFVEKHGRLPTMASTYGSGHMVQKQDIDEQVSYYLAERGIKINSATIEITPLNNRDSGIEHHGRNADGSGFDYQINVRSNTPAVRGTQIGESVAFVGPAFLLKNIHKDMSMNSLITAFNKLDQAVADVDDKDKFNGNPDIKKASQSKSIGDYLSDEQIAEIRKLGDKIYKSGVKGEYDEYRKPTKKLEDLDKKLHDVAEAVMPNVENSKNPLPVQPSPARR